MSESEESFGSPGFKSGNKTERQKRRESSLMRRKSTIKDGRTPIDKFVDTYWKKNIEMPRDEIKKESIGEIDMVVHKLIHEMIVMSEDDPQMKNAVHLKESMIQHQELILAVKDKIKPGLCSIIFKKFTKDMLKDYFNKL